GGGAGAHLADLAAPALDAGVADLAVGAVAEAAASAAQGNACRVALLLEAAAGRLSDCQDRACLLGAHHQEFIGDRKPGKGNNKEGPHGKGWLGSTTLVDMM